MSNQELPIKFKLSGIDIEEFAILEKNFIENKDIGFQHGLSFEIDDENKLIACIVTFEFLCKDNIFLKLQTRNHFSINLKCWQETLLKTNEIIIPKGLLAHLATIGVGTARGVLLAKTENTEFSKFIIPLINLQEMIQEDMVIENEVKK